MVYSRGLPGEFLRQTDGAVAPIAAVALLALIAAGGLAFDYARMASVDTELQNAADQAALAAASQLDGKAGTCERAANAANALLQNETRFANDGSGRGVAIALETSCDATGSIRFYEDKAKTKAASTDATARFVEVTVNARRAQFALTPVVAAFGSPDLIATAFAGLGSSVCKVPPLMMCNPAETASSTGLNVNLIKGIGIRLVAGGSSGAWAPGNFGYLETNLGPGASALEYALGANLPPGDCVSTEAVSTKPGLTTSVTDAINTRFDIYESGLVKDCTTGTCSPALNTRKDLVHEDFPKVSGNDINECKLTGGKGWALPEVPYQPTSTALPYALTKPTAMGFPRDVCHAVSSDGTCTNGRIGNGVWDRNLYFAVNHPELGTDWKTHSSITTWAADNGVTDLDKITRYDVYRWEIDTDSLTKGDADSKGLRSYSGPMCGTGVAASASQPDRRKATVAVVDCIASGIKGSATNVPVNKWVEVFLVEPSLDRKYTSKSDIYVEIVKEAQTLSDGSNLQVIRRDIPYLIE